MQEDKNDYADGRTKIAAANDSASATEHRCILAIARLIGRRIAATAVMRSAQLGISLKP